MMNIIDYVFIDETFVNKNHIGHRNSCFPKCCESVSTELFPSEMIYMTHVSYLICYLKFSCFVF